MARGIIIFVAVCVGLFSFSNDVKGGQVYVLDGYGGVHAEGNAPAILPASSYFGWDIARDIVINCDKKGYYVLDGYGGIHAGGNATPITATSYWGGWDIAKAISASCAEGVTRYLTISGGSFTPCLGSYNYSTLNNVLQTSAAGYYFQAPVNLPQGAYIKKMTVYYYDASATDFTVGLSRAYLPTWGGVSLATFTTTGASGTSSGFTTFSYAIDNSIYSYSLDVSGMDGTANHKLEAVILEYTVSDPLP